jgi:uncharacterized protein YoxC
VLGWLYLKKYSDEKRLIGIVWNLNFLFSYLKIVDDFSIRGAIINQIHLALYDLLKSEEDLGDKSRIKHEDVISFAEKNLDAIVFEKRREEMLSSFVKKWKKAYEKIS